MRLWVFNHLPSNPDLNWFSLTCRDSVLLTWVSKLQHTSWSEGTDSPLLGNRWPH